MDFLRQAMANSGPITAASRKFSITRAEAGNQSTGLSCLWDLSKVNPVLHTGGTYLLLEFNIISVVIPGLEKLDTSVTDEIDDAVFLGQPSRPDVRRQVFQRFGPAGPREGIAQNCFDEADHPERRFTVGLPPASQVLEKLRLGNRFTILRAQDQPRDAVCPGTSAPELFAAAVPGARHWSGPAGASPSRVEENA